jgi:hypothetical protein
MVLEVIKRNLHIKFVNFMCFFAIISLLFFPTQFSEELTYTIKETADSIIKPIGTENFPENLVSSTLVLFTYQHAYHGGLAEIRNCGPFWEPGMFSVFLNIALMINLFINKTDLFSKKNIVFMITIGTTVSTAGILSLFLILITKFFISQSKAKRTLYFPFLILFIYLSYNYVWKLDFISQKIDNNISTSEKDKRSRFGAVIYHFTELSNSPLIGASLKIGESEKGLVAFEEKDVSPNGLSLVFFNWGIPVGILYFILFYVGLKRWLIFCDIQNKLLPFIFFFMFCFLVFSQDITSRHFYLMILLFVLSYSKSNFIQTKKHSV